MCMLLTKTSHRISVWECFSSQQKELKSTFDTPCKTFLNFMGIIKMKKGKKEKKRGREEWREMERGRKRGRDILGLLLQKLDEA